MAQPEARLSRAIMTALRARGAFVFKVHGGPLTMAGLPDVVGVYRGRFLGLEVKTPTGELHGRQTYVLTCIARAGGVVAVPRSVADALVVLDAIDTMGDVPPVLTGPLRRLLPPAHAGTGAHVRGGATAAVPPHEAGADDPYARG